MKHTLHLLLCLLAFNANAQIITTVAGIGAFGFSGDNNPATTAELAGPYSVALDGIGNFYIADGYNNRIRKVDATGIITTIAGTDIQGYNGDNILATNAELWRPAGAACDHAGNVYFTDAYNNRIRKIDVSTGIITTVAGTGIGAYNGDGIRADTAQVYDPHCIVIDSLGNLYFTDFANHRIRYINTIGIISTIAGTGVAGNTGDNGPATDAQINSPYGIVVDKSGNIYFADYEADVIRKIDRFGIITKFAGTGVFGFNGDDIAANTAKLYRPTGLGVDANSNIYIADGFNGRIRKVSIASGIINTIAGNGIGGYNGDDILATAAELGTPADVTIDGAGSIYIADFGNDRIRYIRNTEGVSSINSTNEFLNIYPNPNNGAFTVNIAASIQEQANVRISNLLGTKIKEVVVTTNKLFEIQLSDPPGVYLLTVITQNKMWSEKVILSR